MMTRKKSVILEVDIALLNMRIVYNAEVLELSTHIHLAGCVP